MPMNLLDPQDWKSSLSQTANQVVVGDLPYWVQDGAKPWSLTSPARGVLRFEVRPGDVWTYADTAVKERSEVSGVLSYATGVEVDLSYGFKLEPGPPNTAVWAVIGQLHQDAATAGSPPFAIGLKGEQIVVSVGFSDATGKPVQEMVYLDPTPVQRGHTYDIRVAVTFDPGGAGSLVVWRDGVQIVGYRGALGYTGQTSTYFKEGIYRAASSETLVADYSGLSVTASAGLTHIGAAMPAQLTLKQVLSGDTGASGSDLISSQGLVHLFGVATSTRTVTVRDGAIALGQVAADPSGSWSWWGTLEQGSHTLAATAVSASGVTTTTASAASIVIDRTAPAAPSVTGVIGDTGRSASDLVTSAHKLSVTGTAEAGALVKVLLSGAVLGTTMADATGHWTYDASANPLVNGCYNLSATATDTAGNISAGSTNILLNGSARRRGGASGGRIPPPPGSRPPAREGRGAGRRSRRRGGPADVGAGVSRAVDGLDARCRVARPARRPASSQGSSRRSGVASQPDRHHVNGQPDSFKNKQPTRRRRETYEPCLLRA